MQNVVEFIGEDGSLVVVDPKPIKDGKRVFQFNRVFGPVSTQGMIFLISWEGFVFSLFCL